MSQRGAGRYMCRRNRPTDTDQDEHIRAAGANDDARAACDDEPACDDDPAGDNDPTGDNDPRRTHTQHIVLDILEHSRHLLDIHILGIGHTHIRVLLLLSHSVPKPCTAIARSPTDRTHRATAPLHASSPAEG